LNAIKRGEQFPWMLEATKNTSQMAIIQLGKVFRNFFAGRVKYPKLL
jgi:putative transposase